MKYLDDFKHIKKSDDYQPSKRSTLRLEKKSIESFKKKVPDKFWFESLNIMCQISIVNDYQHNKICSSFGFGKFNLEKFWIKNKIKYPGDKSLIRELKLKTLTI